MVLHHYTVSIAGADTTARANIHRYCQMQALAIRSKLFCQFSVKLFISGAVGWDGIRLKTEEERKSILVMSLKFRTGNMR